MGAIGKLYVGTSGWHYKHWTGTFYPPDTKESLQFDYYSKHFRTVEINNSFYHLPLLRTFNAWRRQSPAGFTFAVKGSRFITHMKKLNVTRASISKFFNRIAHLEDKLGPVLFQLPPRWRVNGGRLDEFLSKLPPQHRYTFEFRDHSWYTEDVYEILQKHNAAFCIYDLTGHQSPERVTADFVYIRLHGPGDKYQGSYTTRSLRSWHRRINGWLGKGLNVYVYFDNDQLGYAARNALQLLQIAGQSWQHTD